jgi:hypothetical protein
MPNDLVCVCVQSWIDYRSDIHGVSLKCVPKEWAKFISILQNPRMKY